MSYYKDIPLRASIYLKEYHDIPLKASFKSGVGLAVMIGNYVVREIDRLEVREVITRRASEFEMVIFDVANYWENLKYFDAVRIYNDGILIFRGILEHKEKAYQQIRLAGRDDFSLLLERYVNDSYTTQTASYILNDVITAKAPELSTQITTTTITYDREYRNVAVAEIIAEFCELESFQAYVDFNRAFYFEPEGYTDSGKTYDYNTGEGGLSKHNFAELGKKVKNIITVYAATGDTTTAPIAVQRRNPASIALYGEKEVVISDNSLTTEQAALERADYELNRYAVILQSGEIEIVGDGTLHAGQTVYLSIDELGFDSTKFLIIALEHNFPQFLTRLVLADMSIDTSDILQTFLKGIKKSDAAQSDFSAPLARYEYFYEEVEISAEYEIYKIISTGLPEYNTFDYNTDDYGPESGDPTLIGSGNMVMTNDGLNAIRNMLFGDTITEPTHIGVGIGTTPALVTDTALEDETQTLPREAMDSGFPTKPEDYKVEYQIDIGTGDFNGEDLTELGLFNGSGADTMFCRQVFDAIAKNATFSLKAKVRLTINGV